MIFLQKCLISSRFNQKLKFWKRERQFVVKFITKNCSRPFRWRSFGRPRQCHIACNKWATIPWWGLHSLLDFQRSIFIGASTSNRVSLGHSPIVKLNRKRRISLMRSTVAHFSRAWDWMLQDPPCRLQIKREL